MSDYQQKDMEGVLFKNERKEQGSNHPDYQGSVTIKGIKYNLGAWINTSKKSGKKFMGLKVKPWEDNAIRTPKQQPAPVQQNDGFDDSEPF